MPSAEMDGKDDLVYSRSRRLVSAAAPSTPSTASSKDANPATELLQDMIREKRAQTQRTQKTYDPVARTAGGEKSALDHRDVQSSPVTSASSRGRPSMGSRRTSGMNGKPVVQKEMGLREMQEHISKTDKQNFDLKLQVFHLRQRNDILEGRVEELEAREVDYGELQTKYEALLLESDRQKLILDDAVAQIIDLQGENEELQAALGSHYAGISSLQPVGSRSSQRAPSTNGHPPVPSTPPQAAGRPSQQRQASARSLRSSTSRRNLVTPPPPREDKKRTTGLHSFYQSGETLNQANPSLISVNKPGSVFSGDDEDDHYDRQMLNSPRLSILSESGFSSIYGSPKDSIQASSPTENEKSRSLSPPRDESSPSQRSAQREARINLWIEEKPSSSTPVKRAPKAGANDRFTSIEQVLRNKSSVSREQPRELVTQEQQKQSPPRKANDSQRRREMKGPSRILTTQSRSHSSSLTGSMTFGGKLPPTPDTMSTATIGGPNSSTQSIITEKSLLDHSGPPSKGYANLVAYGRPRTSDSDSPRQSPNQLRKGLKGLGFDDELGLEHSDDEVQSTHAEPGEPGDLAMEATDLRPPTSSPFMGGPVHTDRLSGATGNSRPPLTTHQTDLMFNGEGFALVQPSRTISYPSPRGSSRHTSARLSPISQRSGRSQNSQKSSGMSDRTVMQSPKLVHDSRGTAVTTPTRLLSKEDNPMSLAKPLEHWSPTFIGLSQQYSETANIQRPKSGRFQFFRRSNSQNAATVLNGQTTSPARPPVVRSTSSTRAQPRLPRPESFYGMKPKPDTFSSVPW